MSYSYIFLPRPVPRPDDFFVFLSPILPASSTGTSVFNSDTGLFDVIGTKKYKLKGTYSVLVAIADDAGASATANSTLKTT